MSERPTISFRDLAVVQNSFEISTPVTRHPNSAARGPGWTTYTAANVQNLVVGLDIGQPGEVNGCLFSAVVELADGNEVSVGEGV